MRGLLDFWDINGADKGREYILLAWMKILQLPSYSVNIGENTYKVKNKNLILIMEMAFWNYVSTEYNAGVLGVFLWYLIVLSL